MRRKLSIITSVQRCLATIKVDPALDTQACRRMLVFRLVFVFNMATSIATGEVKELKVGNKMQSVTPKERQMWAHVAAHVAEVMGNLSTQYEEEDFKKDLSELERQIDEIRKTQLQRNKEGDHPIATSPADANSGAAEPNHS